MAMHFSKDNFEAEVLKGTGVALVDFWAPWCAPCRMMSPVIDELSVQYDGRVKIGKVNVDEEGELAQRYNIMSIPTLIVFKGGQPVDMIVGLQTKAGLAEKLEKHLS
jgi:thioredoxin 1